MHEQLPANGNLATEQALRTAQANGGHLGLTREQAAEHLKARGILAPNADGTPNYVAPATLPPHLAALLDAPAADLEETSRRLFAAGHDASVLLAKVQPVLPAGKKATELSPQALLSIAAHIDHHATMAKRFKR